MKKFTTILATGLLMTALWSGTALAETNEVNGNEDITEVSGIEMVDETELYNEVSANIKYATVGYKSDSHYKDTYDNYFFNDGIYLYFDVYKYDRADNSVITVQLTDSKGSLINKWNENLDEFGLGSDYFFVWIENSDLPAGNYKVTYWTDHQAKQSFDITTVLHKSYDMCGPFSTYDIDRNTDILTIYGKGPIIDFPDSDSGFFDRSGEAAPIKKVIIQNGITRIGRFSFYSYGTDYWGNGYGDPNTTFSLPSTIKAVNSYGFLSCKLAELEFEEGLIELQKLAICSCDIKKIILPKSLKYIGANGITPMDEDKKLEIYYNGTKEDWAKIVIDEENDAIKNANIHFHTHSYTNGVCACGSIANGLAKVNGAWGYYVSGKLQTTKTGIVQKAASTDKNWYFVKNGVYTKASGIARKADGTSTTWFYVKDGIYTKATGIAQRADRKDDGWYYVTNGQFTTKANGIARKADGSSTTWFYVENGKFTKSTGIAQRADRKDDGWYYVTNGQFTTKANGIARKADGSSTTWYYVQNGKYTKATGIAQRADGANTNWYYVTNGQFTTKATGIAKKADGSSTTWYYVKSGVYTKATCIAPIAGQTTAKYYVKSGVWTKTTGKVTIGTKTYTLKAGVVV